MRGTVLADADGIVRENVRYGQAHKRRKTKGGFAVIGEYEERGAVRLNAAVQLQAVADCRHGVFADAEVHVAPRGERAVFHRIRIFHYRLIGRREIGAAAEEGRQFRRDFIEHDGRGAAGCHGLIEGIQIFHRREIGFLARHGVFILLREFGISIFVFREHLFPLHFFFGARVCRQRAVFVYFFRAGERLFFFPAELFLGFFEIFRAERCAVALFAAFERRAVTDTGAADDDGGFIRSFFRFGDGVGKGYHVVGRGGEGYVQYLPVLRREARAHVFFESNVGIAFDGDIVIVVQ